MIFSCDPPLDQNLVASVIQSGVRDEINLFRDFMFDSSMAKLSRQSGVNPIYCMYIVRKRLWDVAVGRRGRKRCFPQGAPVFEVK